MQANILCLLLVCITVGAGFFLVGEMYFLALIIVGIVCTLVTLTLTMSGTVTVTISTVTVIAVIAFALGIALKMLDD